MDRLSMNTSDEEICRRLARVEGYRLLSTDTPDDNYLRSFDALRPCHESLTIEQKTELNLLLWKRWSKSQSSETLAIWLLLPPADLARMVAEVIGDTP